MVCYYHYMGVATINTPGITTLEILEMTNSDKISTTRSVLDCCNGYCMVMKLVHSW